MAHIGQKSLLARFAASEASSVFRSLDIRAQAHVVFLHLIQIMAAHCCEKAEEQGCRVDDPQQNRGPLRGDDPIQCERSPCSGQLYQRCDDGKATTEQESIERIVMDLFLEERHGINVSGSSAFQQEISRMTHSWCRSTRGRAISFLASVESATAARLSPGLIVELNRYGQVWAVVPRKVPPGNEVDLATSDHEGNPIAYSKRPRWLAAMAIRQSQPCCRRWYGTGGRLK